MVANREKDGLPAQWTCHNASSTITCSSLNLNATYSTVKLHYNARLCRCLSMTGCSRYQNSPEEFCVRYGMISNFCLPIGSKHSPRCTSQKADVNQTERAAGLRRRSLKALELKKTKANGQKNAINRGKHFRAYRPFTTRAVKAVWWLQPGCMQQPQADQPPPP